MVDVVLIHSPMVLKKRSDEWVVVPGDEVSSPHLGLLYLAANLEKHDVSVKILDVTAQRLTLEDIMETIGNEKPRLIGISSTSAGIRSAVKLGGSLKREFKDDVSVCLGGAHVNTDTQFIERFPVFDFSISGSSEKTFYECYAKLKNGEKVKGCLQGEEIEPLDAIPFPARHLVDHNVYVREENRGVKSPATILSSRGCPFSCSFCTSRRSKMRYRSAKNVVDEMEAAYQYCDGHFSFVDDVHTLNKKKTIELCDEVLRRGLKVKWTGITRVDTLNEEVVQKLSAAGCYDLFFGVESGNERVRNEVIEKEVTNEEIRNAMMLCRKYGIHTNLFLMIGFPTETMAEIEDTVNVGAEVGADMIGIHNTIPFPGTEVFRYAVQEGMMPGDMIDRFVRGEGWDDSETFFEKWPRFIPKGLQMQDLTDAKKRAYRRFYLRPSWFFSRFRHWWNIPNRFKYDMDLVMVAPRALFMGKTKGSAS